MARAISKKLRFEVFKRDKLYSIAADASSWTNWRKTMYALLDEMDPSGSEERADG